MLVESGSTASIVSNGTDFITGWVPDPNGRGTREIVYGSLLTLFTCVWTALHINVIPKSTYFKRMKYKTKWMVVAIFLPELVLWQAIDQWIEAQHIRQWWSHHNGATPRTWTMARLIPEWWPGRSGSQNETEPGMSMETAFFVVMGGFTIGAGKDFSTFPYTLTPQGFKHLTELGIIDPNSIDASLISDKAKADNTVKLLVLLQACWFLAQFIARLVYKLPATLLEIHVAIQVVCASGMYCFWWSKPFDVVEPICLVRGREVGALLAIAYNSLGFNIDATDSIPGDEVLPPVEPTFKFDVLESTLEPHEADEPYAPRYIARVQSPAHCQQLRTSIPPSLGEILFVTRSDNKVRRSIQYAAEKDLWYRMLGLLFDAILFYTYSQWAPILPKPMASKLADMLYVNGEEFRQDQFENGRVIVLRGESFVEERSFQLRYEGPDRDTYVLKSVDIECFSLAARAIRSEQQVVGAEYRNGVKCLAPERTQLYLTDRARHGKVSGRIAEPYENRSSMIAREGSRRDVDLPIDRWVEYFVSKNALENPGIWIIIPESIHSRLPTQKAAMASISLAIAACHSAALLESFNTEIERILWIVVCAATGIFPLVLLSYAYLVRRWKLPYYDWLLPYTKGDIYMIYILLNVLYLLARAYIFVEAFVSLRRVPAGCYESIPWTNFFAHLS